MFHGRQSWDTAVKHSVRTGILKDILSPEQIALIPRYRQFATGGRNSESTTSTQKTYIVYL